MPELHLRDIRRVFGEHAALRGVSLTVSQGEFVAILGPSGGGKSTLLNTIGLIDRPDAGTYTIDGRDTSALDERARAATRSETFAFVFQGFHLLDRRPVIDSVELGLLHRGIDSHERRRRARRALEHVGLAARTHDIAANLSGGQRQRVAIARAIASGAPVLVADEPTGNLDSRTGKQILELLRALHRGGTTIILVTHDHEIALAADRTITIADGETTDNEPVRRAAAPSYPTPPGTASRVRRRDILADAARSLTSRPGRTAGLVGAVATAVALAVTTLGIGVTASAQVSDRFDRHVNRDVSVEWLAVPAPENGAPAAPTVTAGPVEQLLERTRAINGVDAVALLADRGSIEVRATPARPAFRVPLVTISGDLSATARLTIHRFDRVGVYLGESVAAQLGITTSGPDNNPQVSIDDVSLPVAGIVTASPRLPALLGSVITPPGILTGAEPPSRWRLLARTSPGAAQQVAQQLPLAADPTHPDLMHINAPTDPRALRDEIENDVQATLYAFTALAVIAAVAALTNAMVLAVLERRAEIGLRRAIGARGGQVAALIVSEAAMVGSAGGIVGLVLGWSGLLVISILRGWIPVLDPLVTPYATIGGIIVGVVGGGLAAFRATRITPQDALRL